MLRHKLCVQAFLHAPPWRRGLFIQFNQQRRRKLAGL